MSCALPELLQFYDEDYLFLADALTTPERTRNELEFIWSVLHLKRGDRVLDLGCGHIERSDRRPDANGEQFRRRLASRLP